MGERHSLMAKQRPSQQKRDREIKKRERERRKREKAEVKREQRLSGSTTGPEVIDLSIAETDDDKEAIDI